MVLSSLWSRTQSAGPDDVDQLEVDFQMLVKYNLERGSDRFGTSVIQWIKPNNLEQLQLPPPSRYKAQFYIIHSIQRRVWYFPLQNG